MPPAITLLLTLPTLFLCSGDVGDGGTRRVLHQPLFPIEWTPPPSPPPPPAPDFTSDPCPLASPDGPPGDFFPPAPPTPAAAAAAGGGGTTSSLTTVAADPSNTPSGPAAGRHGGGPTKATIVAAGAAAAAAVALLGFACAFLITGRGRRRSDSQKLLGPDRGPADQRGGPSATDFLYVGMVEPSTPAHHHHGPTTADLVGSPYCKLRSERARRGVSRDEATDHPSPELRPLPPLQRATTLGSSDEDAYYTPRKRSGVTGGSGGEAWSEASASSPPTTTTASRRSLTSDLWAPLSICACLWHCHRIRKKMVRKSF